VDQYVLQHVRELVWIQNLVVKLTIVWKVVSAPQEHTCTMMNVLSETNAPASMVMSSISQDVILTMTANTVYARMASGIALRQTVVALKENWFATRHLVTSASSPK